MIKKFVSLMLVFMLSISIVPTNVYAQANDYSNHWAHDTIEKWRGKNIVNGYEDGSFKPESYITRAEFAQILVRIFGYSDISKSQTYSDVKENDWFYNAVNVISSTKVMYDYTNTSFRPNDEITREEAIYAIANAYKIVKNTEDAFKDDNKISQWARQNIYAMYANKYINGTPENLIKPKDSLTRAELLTIINNITDTIINEKGTYETNINGNLVVNTRDVILKGMTIEGNLYLAEGIGDGDVTLDNITVTGDVIIEGGGEHSIKSKNSTYFNSIIVNTKNPVRVVIEGDAVKIDILENVIITLSGNFEEVVIQGNTNVNVVNASIENLYVAPVSDNNQTNTNIVLDSKTTVDSITADNKVTIAGKGSIKELIVNVAGVKTEQKADKVSITDGITAVIAGKTEGEKSTNTNSPSTGGTTPGSTTGNDNPSPSTGNDNPSPSTGDDNPAPSTGDDNPSPSTGDDNPSPSTGDDNPAPSTGDDNPSPSTGDENPPVNPPKDDKVSRIALCEQLLSSKTIKGFLYEPTSDNILSISKQLSDWDILTSSQQTSVAWIIQNKIAYPYPDGSFGGDKYFTKAEIAKLVVERLLNIFDIKNVPTDIKIDDVEDNLWSKDYILTFIKSGLADGIYDSKNYYPENIITSEELAKVIANIEKYLSDHNLDNLKDKYCISGTVSDKDGNVYKYAKIEIRSSSGKTISCKPNKDGFFSIEVDSKQEYLINASYYWIDEGYKVNANISKLISDYNIDLVLDRVPVIKFEAADKKGNKIYDYFYVCTYDEDGKLFMLATTDYRSLYDNNSDEKYVYCYKLSDESLVPLTNIEVEKQTIDEYTRVIKLILNDYGISDTTVSGTISCDDNVSVSGIKIYLDENDYNGNKRTIVTETDKNGNYTFHNLNKDCMYRINNKTFIQYNNICYTVEHEAFMINRDMQFSKAYSLDISIVDKNGIAIPDTAWILHDNFEGHLVSVNLLYVLGDYEEELEYVQLDQNGHGICATGQLDAGYSYIVKGIVSDEINHVTSQSITIIEGQYEPIKIILKFNEFDVLNCIYGNNISGNVYYATSGTAITGTAITSDMCDDITIKLINSNGNTVMQVHPNKDGTYFLPYIRPGDYKLHAEMIKDGKQYNYYESLFVSRYGNTNIIQDITMKLKD